jgi:hypothetical protein
VPRTCRLAGRQSRGDAIDRKTGEGCRGCPLQARRASVAALFLLEVVVTERRALRLQPPPAAATRQQAAALAAGSPSDLALGLGVLSRGRQANGPYGIKVTRCNLASQ